RLGGRRGTGDGRWLRCDNTRCRQRAAADLAEETTPFRADACRVGEEALVLVFDVRSLRARERARLVEFAQGAAHGLRDYTGPVQYCRRRCPELLAPIVS